jgi:hypothetical protein
LHHTIEAPLQLLHLACGATVQLRFAMQMSHFLSSASIPMLDASMGSPFKQLLLAELIEPCLLASNYHIEK